MTESFWFWMILAWVLAIGFTALRAYGIVDLSPVSTLVVVLTGLRAAFALWDQDCP